MFNVIVQTNDGDLVLKLYVSKVEEISHLLAVVTEEGELLKVRSL